MDWGLVSFLKCKFYTFAFIIQIFLKAHPIAHCYLQKIRNVSFELEKLTKYERKALDIREKMSPKRGCDF